MLYAPTDVQSIIIPEGCGQPHAIDSGAQLVIECGPCEQAMSAHQHLGWAAKPELVAPTCDEVAQAERDEATAQKAGIARLNAYANNGGTDGSTSAALAALVAQNAALMEQVMALTAQRQAAPPEAAPPRPVSEDAAPVADTPEAPAVDAVEAPRRGPGRPRKTPTE